MNISLDITPQFMEQFDKAIKECVSQAMSGFVIEDRAMTKKEAAEFMQISLPTLESFMREGLPYFQRGQVIRFLYSDIVTWMKGR